MPASPSTGARPLRRDARANRGRILRAANELFSEHGIEAPLDEVARRAGVGTGTFYRHFANRDDLLDALFEERVRRFDAMMGAASEAENAWDGLVGLMTTSFALQATDRGLKDVLVARARGAGRLSQPSPRTRAALTDLMLADLPLVSAAILGVIDLTATIAPDAWRRILQIVLDGLRAERSQPTALPHPPLDLDTTQAAMVERRTRPKP
jgi:AcrR family transcriptional regulator